MGTNPLQSPRATSSEYLARLFAEGSEPGRLLVLAAHPDDETIGAGGQISTWKDVQFVHVTDGAPPDRSDAELAGCRTREEYASLRRRELERALALAGVTSEQFLFLHFVDQEVSFRLSELAEKLQELFLELSPDAVLTHPYEGGHPDHDATAFAAHAACRELARRGQAPPLFEMTSYHNRAGIMETGEFLPCAGGLVLTRELASPKRRKKEAMLACFSSQRRVLQNFRLEAERFRPAPNYDFGQPPHPGKLFYEMFDWGITGQQWRMLAREALDELEATRE